MLLPNFIVLVHLEVPNLAKPGPTDRPTEFAIAICHLVDTKCHKNSSWASQLVDLAMNETSKPSKVQVLFAYKVFMALGINQVTYSDRKFCRSVGLSVCLSRFCYFRHFQAS